MSRRLPPAQRHGRRDGKHAVVRRLDRCRAPTIATPTSVARSCCSVRRSRPRVATLFRRVLLAVIGPLLGVRVPCARTTAVCSRSTSIACAGGRPFTSSTAGRRLPRSRMPGSQARRPVVRSLRWSAPFVATTAARRFRRVGAIASSPRGLGSARARLRVGGGADDRPRRVGRVLRRLGRRCLPHPIDRRGRRAPVVPKRRGVGGIAIHADGGIVCTGRDVVHVRADGMTRTVMHVDGVAGMERRVHRRSRACLYAGASASPCSIPRPKWSRGRRSVAS